jgi:uncharacterized protein (TIGR03643 family)
VPNVTLAINAMNKKHWNAFLNAMDDIQKTDRIIEMAWEDRTPFEAIKTQFGLSEKEVIEIMRREMKASSFKMWRERVQGRKTKHLKLRSFVKGRHKSKNQKSF